MPYSGDPAGDALDAIRYHLQDTSVDNPLLSDAELDYERQRLAAVYGDATLPIAAALAKTLAARYAGQVTVSSDGDSIDLGALAQKFRDLAEALQKQYEAELAQGAVPVVGGIYPSTDLGVLPPTFGTGMTDNPRAGNQDYGDIAVPDRYRVPDGGEWNEW